MARGHILVGVLVGVFVHPVVGMPVAAREVFRRAEHEGGGT